MTGKGYESDHILPALKKTRKMEKERNHPTLSSSSAATAAPATYRRRTIKSSSKSNSLKRRKRVIGSTKSQAMIIGPSNRSSSSSSSSSSKHGSSNNDDDNDNTDISCSANQSHHHHHYHHHHSSKDGRCDDGTKQYSSSSLSSPFGYYNCTFVIPSKFPMSPLSIIHTTTKSLIEYLLYTKGLIPMSLPELFQLVQQNDDSNSNNDNDKISKTMLRANTTSVGASTNTKGTRRQQKSHRSMTSNSVRRKARYFLRQLENWNTSWNELLGILSKNHSILQKQQHPSSSSNTEQRPCYFTLISIGTSFLRAKEHYLIDGQNLNWLTCEDTTSSTSTVGEENTATSETTRLAAAAPQVKKLTSVQSTLARRFLAKLVTTDAEYDGQLLSSSTFSRSSPSNQQLWVSIGVGTAKDVQDIFHHHQQQQEQQQQQQEQRQLSSLQQDNTTTTTGDDGDDSTAATHDSQSTRMDKRTQYVHHPRRLKLIRRPKFDIPLSLKQNQRYINLQLFQNERTKKGEGKVEDTTNNYSSGSTSTGRNINKETTATTTTMTTTTTTLMNTTTNCHWITLHSPLKGFR